jgi:prolyl-tRNA editing enzyme YbaK/EbsC (Cys-tRNA(Pro) deacylase)
MDRGRPGAIERFFRAAEALGLTLEVRECAQGTRTAGDAARAIGCEVGQIVKSLVFVAGHEPFLALTSGSNRVDTARLGELMGGLPIRRASPDEAREATGYAIGGTPPFGHRRHLRVFLDRDLLGYEEVWAAAGTPTAVFPITPEDLLRASEALPADLKER